MHIFKPGDRVRLTFTSGSSVAGQTGTVLEEGVAPWVLFDTPTMWHDIPPQFADVEGAKEWHFDCVSADDLEPLDEAQPPQAEATA